MSLGLGSWLVAESSIQMVSSCPGSPSLKAVSGACVTGLALKGVVTAAAPQSWLGEKGQEMMAREGCSGHGHCKQGDRPWPVLSTGVCNVCTRHQALGPALGTQGKLATCHRAAGLSKKTSSQAVLTPCSRAWGTE